MTAIEGIVLESVPSDPEAEMILAAREYAETVFRYEALAGERFETEEALIVAFRDRDVPAWADAKISLDDLAHRVVEALSQRGQAEAIYQRARIAAGRRAR